MSVLLQTLYCVSGRAEIISDIGGTGNAVLNPDNTYAGTHDASDATYDRAYDVGDYDTHTPVSDFWVHYTMTPAAAVGTIDFVRVKHRVAGQFTAGTGVLESRPSIYVAAPIEFGAARTPVATPANYTDDQATDLFTPFGAWTNAKINAKKWGLYLHIHGTDPSDEANIDVFEFEIEVWGTPPPGTGARSVRQEPVTQISGG